MHEVAIVDLKQIKRSISAIDKMTLIKDTSYSARAQNSQAYEMLQFHVHKKSDEIGDLKNLG